MAFFALGAQQMSNNEDIQNPEAQPEEQVQDNAAPQEEQKLTLEEQIECLTKEIEQVQQDAETHKDAAIRAKAEAENIRRRAEREVSNASKFALEKFSKELLAVVDSLEKALEHPAQDDAQKAARSGVELTYKLMVDTLAKFSVEQISPLGDVFDPSLHEALVMQESAEHDPNCVMDVIQNGYSLNGRLIRPARVVVAKGQAPEIDQTV
jgi:molecular chaperone GrpE